MQVLIKPYGICWQLGPDNFTFVSIGTGSLPRQTVVHRSRLCRSAQARAALAALDDGRHPDAGAGADAVARRMPRSVADQFGDRQPRRRAAAGAAAGSASCATTCSSRSRGSKRSSGKTLTEERVAAYRNMDDPKIIQPIYELALEAAQRAGEGDALLPGGARHLTRSSPRKRGPSLDQDWIPACAGMSGREIAIRPARRESTGRGSSPAILTADWPDPRHSAASRTASSGCRS